MAGRFCLVFRLRRVFCRRIACRRLSQPALLAGVAVVNQVVQQHLHDRHKRHAEQDTPEAEQAAADRDGQQDINRPYADRAAHDAGLNEIAVDLLHDDNVNTSQQRGVDITGQERDDYTNDPANDSTEIGDDIHQADHHAQQQRVGHHR